MSPAALPAPVTFPGQEDRRLWFAAASAAAPQLTARGARRMAQIASSPAVRVAPARRPGGRRVPGRPPRSRDLHRPGGPAALRPQRRRQEASAATPPRAVYVLLTQGQGSRRRASGAPPDAEGWDEDACVRAQLRSTPGGRGSERRRRRQREVWRGGGAGRRARQAAPLRVQYSPAPRRSPST